MSETSPLAEQYDQGFFDDQVPLSISSADAVVPSIVTLLAPQSVVDVGCGVGTWLAAFKRAGVPVVHGFDGAYARRAGLLVDDAEFTAVDLTRPLAAGRRFDLALSLEVGEHLPESAAALLVQSVTRLAPAVLFSAAFPGQGGTNHVNEQWPVYWQALFARHDFAVLDPIRPLVWSDDRVAWWYRCNMFLYVDRALLARTPRLAELERVYASNPLTLTHKKVLRRLAGSGRFAKYRSRIAHRLLG
jgi:SAM-dependent methyltransferase